MAQVKWQKRAENELYRYLVRGFFEFGETTANSFAAAVARINDDLCKYPEIGFPEPLINDNKDVEEYGIITQIMPMPNNKHLL